jgi:hypothetical protein
MRNQGAGIPNWNIIPEQEKSSSIKSLQLPANPWRMIEPFLRRSQRGRESRNCRRRIFPAVTSSKRKKDFSIDLLRRD